MDSFMVSLRVAVATMVIAVVAYTLVVLGVAKAVSPDAARGSLLVREDGTLVGSRLIAQKFERAGYFWARPSAADYNASGAAGSNKSPTSADLTGRAAKLAARYGATAERPLPADLAAASGAGLDPHITERAALYQADRVALARALPRARVESLIAKQSFSPGGPLTQERLVNVLELNLALDHEASAGTH